MSLNLEQQVNDSVGVFARAGWADGTIEPWDFTDIDRTVQAGVSIAGKPWGRPDDTIGVAGVINGLAPVHQAYFDAGGLGHPGRRRRADRTRPREISSRPTTATRSTPSMKVTVDYQFIVNPAYNADRGPVNVFAGRFHSHSDHRRDRRNPAPAKRRQTGLAPWR